MLLKSLALMGWGFYVEDQRGVPETTTKKNKTKNKKKTKQEVG